MHKKDISIWYHIEVDNKSLTLRLPASLYKEMASRRSKSITAYIVEAVEEKIARERQEELAAGFATLVGSDEDAGNSWQSAQQKAMKHVDS